MARKCTVGYTRSSNPSGFVHRFDRLEKCCDTFENWFLDTGSRKHRSFNSNPSEERSGVNLVTRGFLSVVLRLTGDQTREDYLKFCPFCGAKVELKCTKTVKLEPKTKEIPDGYEEIVSWQEGVDK